MQADTIEMILRIIWNFLGVVLTGLLNGGIVVAGLLAVPFIDMGWSAYAKMRDPKSKVDGQVEMVDNLLAGICALGFLFGRGEWAIAAGIVYLLLEFFYATRKYPKRSWLGQVLAMPGEMVNDIGVLSAFAAGVLWMVIPSGTNFLALLVNYVGSNADRPGSLGSSFVRSSVGLDGVLIGVLTLAFFWTLLRYLRAGIGLNKRGTVGPLLLCYLASVVLLIASLSLPIAWLLGLLPVGLCIWLWTWYTRTAFYLKWEDARAVLVENCTLTGIAVMILFVRGGFGTPETFSQYWAVILARITATG